MRTGIIVAAPEVVKAVIVNLSPTRFGAAIATPLLRDGRLKQLSDDVIRPFYRNQAQTAVSLLKRELGAYPLKIHKPEGAIFLWLWFENLPVSSQTLYEMLKAEGTLITPGEHFFVGIDTQDYPHEHCAGRGNAGKRHRRHRQGGARFVRCGVNGKVDSHSVKRSSENSFRRPFVIYLFFLK